MKIFDYMKLMGRTLCSRAKNLPAAQSINDFLARQGVNVGGLFWLSAWLYRSFYAATASGPHNEAVGSWVNFASTLVALFLGHTKFGYPAAMAMGGLGTLAFWSGRAANAEWTAFAACFLILSAAAPVAVEPWAQKPAEKKLNELRATGTELMQRKKTSKIKDFYYSTLARDRVFASRYMYAYNILMGICDYLTGHTENLLVYTGSVIGNIAAEFSKPDKAVPFKEFLGQTIRRKQKKLPSENSLK